VVLCGPSGSQLIAATASTTVTIPVDSTTGTHTFTVTSQDAVGNVTMPASSVTYSVSKATPVITWANPAAIVYGTPLSANQLNATANVPGTFTYTPAAGTILGVGTQTLSVVFTPNDTTDYSNTSATVQLSVTKAPTTITWANPAAIVYGTPLSATQLNAAANVPGTFVYTPAAGAVLGVGTQTLSVVFTPTDTADFSSSAKQVSLTVSQAATTTTITSISPNPAPPNSPVTVSWSVIGSTNTTAPTGTVTVKASTGENCSGAVLTSGCVLTFTTTGSRTVTANYSGDLNFQASSTTGAVQVTVGDFSIAASPTSQTISSGHNAVYSIMLTPIGGLTGTVNLSCSGGPPNTTCTVSPSSVSLQGGSVTSIVTLMANKNVTHGTYTLTFTGSYSNGTLVHSVPVTLTVKGQN